VAALKGESPSVIPRDRKPRGISAGDRCRGGDLENGSYYFQVTDPAGKVLLSYDHESDTLMVRYSVLR